MQRCCERWSSGCAGPPVITMSLQSVLVRALLPAAVTALRTGLALVGLFFFFGSPSSSAEAGTRLVRVMLMPGSEMATPGYVLESGRPGPVVAVIAGIHGDEPAGRLAANRLVTEIPHRGRRIVLPQANRLAAESAVRMPYFMQDLNRAFPGRRSGTSTERLAHAVFEFVRRHRPDLVIDLHEAGSPDDPGASEVANSLIISKDARAASLALAVLETVPPVTAGKPFTVLSGAPRGSLNREVSERLGIPVITVETDRSLALEARVGVQGVLLERIMEQLAEESP